MARDLTAEAPDASGLTSRLLLLYAERELGRAGVDALLARCGLEDHEAELRDEGTWFSFATKIELFEALTELVGSPDTMYRVGRAAFDLNFSPTLKLGLRALGSPGTIYANTPRVSGKFSSNFHWEQLDSGPQSVRLRFFSLDGTPYLRHDCLYNRGLLASAPGIFGLPNAEIRHEACGADGADGCVYDVAWEAREAGAAAWTGAAVASAALAGAGLALSPLLLPLAAGPGLWTAGRALRRHRRSRRLSWVNLEKEVLEQKEVADRLIGSLHDIVSDLRLDDVLAKVTENAKAAVTGKRFVLLVGEPGALRCRGTSGVSAPTVASLEHWVAARPELLDRPLLLDHHDARLAAEPGFSDAAFRLGAVYATPLAVGGRKLGVLLALGYGFLPRDTQLLDTYAAQAAIAVANAQHVERLESLAGEDGLTGLANHRAFHEQVERELARSRRTGERFSLVLFDLDRFKQVNDELGHAEGDRVLAEVGAGLRAICRDGDLACRLGGDEFALLLPGTPADGAVEAAERVGAAVSAVGAGVGVSAGVAEWPRDGADKVTLLAHADGALYRVKPAAGRPADARALAELCGAVGALAGPGRTRDVVLACTAHLAAAPAPDVAPEVAAALARVV